jgi:hypothetical protein
MSTLTWIVPSGTGMSSLALVGAATVVLPERVLERVLLPLVGHNFIGGLAVGGAFVVDIRVGLSPGWSQRRTRCRRSSATSASWSAAAGDGDPRSRGTRNRAPSRSSDPRKADPGTPVRDEIHVALDLTTASRPDGLRQLAAISSVGVAERSGRARSG